VVRDGILQGNGVVEGHMLVPYLPAKKKKKKKKIKKKIFMKHYLVS